MYLANPDLKWDRKRSTLYVVLVNLGGLRCSQSKLYLHSPMYHIHNNSHPNTLPPPPTSISWCNRLKHFW
jgi:hypothetical protein